MANLASAINEVRVSELFMNRRGQFVNTVDDVATLANPILPKNLPSFLDHRIGKPCDVTDVFVWVHGWNTRPDEGRENAQRIFQRIVGLHAEASEAYNALRPFRPWFVSVIWPSCGWYYRIRKRANQMTTLGEAEFFIARLLDFLDYRHDDKILQGPNGFYLHCLGHSFGGRFLTAAVTAASNPSASTIGILQQIGAEPASVLGAMRQTPFQYNVDSMVIFQMAAPSKSFQDHLRVLVTEAPLVGPLVLTHTRHDTALGFWHRFAELGQPGIGYLGAREPSELISTIKLRTPDESYVDTEFNTRVINVDASHRYNKREFWRGGAHSDVWHDASAHLILSLAEFVRRGVAR